MYNHETYSYSHKVSPIRSTKRQQDDIVKNTNCTDYLQQAVSRAAERIIGPWGSFNFGPLVYLSLYILCHVMLHESLSFMTKGGSGGTPPEKILKNT